MEFVLYLCSLNNKTRSIAHRRILSLLERSRLSIQTAKKAKDSKLNNQIKLILQNEEIKQCESFLIQLTMKEI